MMICSKIAGQYGIWQEANPFIWEITIKDEAGHIHIQTFRIFLKKIRCIFR